MQMDASYDRLVSIGAGRAGPAPAQDLGGWVKNPSSADRRVGRPPRCPSVHRAQYALLYRSQAAG